MKQIIRYIDLCSGIGGFRVAIENYSKDKENIDFQCVFSADIKEDAIKTYNLNFNENNIKTDIYDIEDLPEFDLLCAGFPCQPFSSAGNKQGFNDTRGGIIFKIIDICKKYNPTYIILENVSNLLTLNNGKDLNKIVTEFENIGYFVNYKKLNSKDFDVPQNRERVFIVCSKSELIDLNLIQKHKTKLLKDIINYNEKYTDIESNFASKILELHNRKPLFGFKMQDKRGGTNNIHSWDIENNGIIPDKQKQLISKIMTERRKKKWAENKKIEWMDGMPLTYNEILTFYPDDNLQEMLDNLVDKKYLRLEKPKDLIDGKRVYVEDGELGYNICKGKLSFPISNILDPNGISPTLTATDSCKLVVIIDNKFIRKLTDNELKMISGFPIEYIIPENVNKYDLFGNIVVPNIIYKILEYIFFSRR
jgi:DNA (cytosine-5)-methyltransferase 1